MELLMNRSIQTLFRTAAVMAGVCPMLWSQVPVKFTAFPAGTSNARDIVTGTDNNLWFTDPQTSQVWRMTPTGTVTAFPITTEDPSWAITRGTDAVWFSSGNVFRGSSSGKRKLAISDTTTIIGRMTPTGVLTSYTTPNFDDVNNIVFGPDGNVWFTYFFRFAIGRMSPDGTVTEFAVPSSSECCEPEAITAGPDGNLWYTRSNAIGRITTTGVVTEFPLTGRSQAPASITAGPDGALWFTDTDRINRITTTGVLTGFPVAAGVTDIVTGADGALWYTRNGVAPGLGRIMTAGAVSEYNTPGDGEVDSHITLGPDGALWLTKGSVIVRAVTATLSPAPASLSFLYRVGGPLPVSQSTSVTSGGTPVAITTAVAPGATWLSVAPPSGTTPVSVTASVNPVGLSPGPYTGQINITGDAANSPSQVAVNLSVLPGLSANPAALTFNYRIGATAPAGQNVVVSSGGVPVSVGAAAIVTTPTGGTWLSVTPTSATTPGTYSVTVSVAGLAAGTYNGLVRFTALDTAGGQLDLPVSITVRPALAAAPTSLSFAYRINASLPGSQTLNVTSGGVPVNVSAASQIQTPTGGSWLSVTPASATTPGVFTVAADPAGLTAGTYTGTITLTALDASGGVVTVPVTFVVSANLTFNPAALTFTYRVGQTVPAAQSVTIASSGSAVSVTSAAIVDSPSGGSWLAVTPPSGSTPATLSVSVNPTGLAPGTYTGRVRTVAQDTAGGQLDVPVTITVLPALAVSPGALSFVFRIGATVPPAQTVAVTSGGVPVAITAAALIETPSGGTWLSVTPPGATTPGNLTVAVNPSGLAAGSYAGTVRITATDSAGGTIEVPVTLSVNSMLTSNPATLTFAYRVDGSIPPAQTVNVTSNGSAVSIASVASVTTPTGGTWLSVSPSSGTTPAALTVSVNPAGLSPGTYTGRIRSTAQDSAGGLSDVVVTLTVSARLTAQPTSLTFTHRVDAVAPEPQTLQVSTSGSPVDLRADASVLTPTGGTWLSVIPSGGATPATFSVLINPAGLPVGTYQGFVNVTALDEANGVLQVPVTLDVVSPLSPTAQPASLTFISNVRSVPEPQSVRILRPGGDQLTVQTELLSTTAGLQVFQDNGEGGGVWATLSVVPKGSTDATFRIRVNPASVATLPYGTYSGVVRVTAGTESPRTVNVPVTLEMKSSTISVGGQCPTVFLGNALNIPITVTGGIGTYSLAFSGPPGLSLVPSGGPGGSAPLSAAITGTPRNIGLFPISVTATDSDGSTAGVFRCNLDVTTPYIPPVVFVTASCPTGDLTVGTPFATPLTASGGNGAFNFDSVDLPPGLSVSGGAISGTPVAAGTYSYTITARSGGAQSAEIRCSLRVLPGPLKITSGCPTNAREGDRYNFPILPTGGLGGGQYEISINGLPAGLVATRGGIQGVATQQGSYSLQIQVRSGDQVVTQSCPLTVNNPAGGPPGPRANLNCPAAVASGGPVSFDVSASGGSGSYTFSLSGPDWLLLTQNGSSATVTGTAGPLGAYPISVTVSDANGSTQASCSLTVKEAALAVTGASCPATAPAGSPLDLPLSITGGTAPYQWQLSPAAGLTLSTAAGASTRITGSPSQVGPLPIAVSVSDAAGNRREFRCSIDVTPAPLTISGQGCPTDPVIRPASVNVSLTAGGGRGEYAWRLSGPSWLTLSSASGPSVSVSGVPAAPGDFSFTATLTDQAETPQGTYSCRFTVPAATPPAFQLNGLTASVGATETGDLQLVLSGPSPVPLTATVTLVFEPDTALPGVTDNPLVQFTNGRQRTITVTIPAGQTTVPLGARVNVGNVAGTVRVIVSSLLDVDRELLGTNRPTSELRLQRSAPVIDSVALTAAGVVIRGFSNTLDMQSVTLTFTPTDGTTIEGPSTFSFTTEVQQFFRQLYQNRPTSGGSAFEVRFPINIGGATDGIASVTVTMRNAAGEVTSSATLR